MLERIIGPLPEWMRASNPVLRYALGSNGPGDQKPPRFRRSLGVLLVILLVVVGYLIADARLDERVLDLPMSQMLIEILFWPFFVVQIAIQIVVVAMTVNTVGHEKRRQTWDNLKATSEGAGLALRAQWSATIFYRIGPLMMILILVRLLLILSVMRDLTAFGGEYLNYLTVSVSPEISLPVGIILLALTLAASLLLPFTAIGMDAAVGLYISTIVQQRTFVVLTQFFLVVVRLVIVIGLLMMITLFREGTLPDGISEIVVWVLILGFAVVGDWGLSLLYLGFLGQVVWAHVSYGAFIGLGMLVFVLIQAAMADGVLALAVRRAERSE